MVGRDCERQDKLFSSVEHADFCLEGVDQPGVPLVEKVDGWSDDQSGASNAADGVDGYECLTGSCW